MVSPVCHIEPAGPLQTLVQESSGGTWPGRDSPAASLELPSGGQHPGMVRRLQGNGVRRLKTLHSKPNRTQSNENLLRQSPLRRPD